jgi:transposase
VLSEASKTSGADLPALLEREGLQRAELEQWRLALSNDLGGSVTVTRQLRKVERELARKDKALAEAAALLILKKKVGHLWADEDDDTEPEKDE